jgi:hypothetical protein
MVPPGDGTAVPRPSQCDTIAQKFTEVRRSVEEKNMKRTRRSHSARSRRRKMPTSYKGAISSMRPRQGAS